MHDNALVLVLTTKPQQPRDKTHTKTQKITEQNQSVAMNKTRSRKNQNKTEPSLDVFYDIWLEKRIGPIFDAKTPL